MKKKKESSPAQDGQLTVDLWKRAQSAKKQPNFRYRPFNLDADVWGSSPEEFTSPDWELLQLDVERYDQSGILEWADETQQQVDWIKLCEKGDEKAIKDVIGKFDDDPSVFDKIAVAAWSSDDVVRHLHDKLERYLALMAALAKAGREEAGRNMARYALRATACASELVATNPEQFRSVAEKELRWPVLHSPNPIMSQADPDWERLGLGAGFPFRLHADSRLNVTDAAGEAALKLWFYVHRLRENTLEVLQRHNLTVADLKPEGDEEPLHMQAARLPQFAPESTVVRNWFAVARAALVSAYPDRKDAAQLNTKIPQLNAIVEAARDRATHGRWRSRIWERLEKKFYWLSGLNPDKPFSSSV